MLILKVCFCILLNTINIFLFTKKELNHLPICIFEFLSDIVIENWLNENLQNETMFFIWLICTMKVSQHETSVSGLFRAIAKLTATGDSSYLEILEWCETKPYDKVKFVFGINQVFLTLNWSLYLKGRRRFSAVSTNAEQILLCLLTLSLQPCPGMRCLLCPPLLEWLCSWRSLLISSCPTESRERESETLRHASHSSHCRHLSASTRPENTEKHKKENNFIAERMLLGWLSPNFQIIVKMGYFHGAQRHESLLQRKVCQDFPLWQSYAGEVTDGWKAAAEPNCQG